jgi:heme exporter protein A
VEARDLVKLYGPTRALASVSLDLSAGRITAIEGPNGSGKSTLLQILSLSMRPTRGSLRFGDRDALRSSALRGRIGLLAHAPLLYPDLTGLENLALALELHGRKLDAVSMASLRERFELSGFAERAARTYSRGQLQRVSLARALLHAPQLLLLDEPSTGLDARGLERLLRVLSEERARGAIVVLVTHDRALVEACADQRIELRAGKLARAPVAPVPGEAS